MERSSLRRFYGRQIFKGALFASTALGLPAIAPRLAFAQIAPNTTPQGGTVVGGSASIAQGSARTTITQSSQNAAINWQSFNVGAAATVQFNQPSASAIALNRVVGGNLSQINGQINANGQIVLINQSGVVFGKGAQVNAESVVVSTSDIATSDFMAGKLNFTGAPRPGAAIINNGNISARQAGLVGLVAPQVANNGLITASLGQVVIAGASAFTLDLYGDQLISLDVTQAVRAVDVGGKPVPALITNNGAILADGGKITLTAQDADALVTQLINAGGIIRANTVGAQTGAVSLQGIGGNISIAGNLLAQGTQAGTKGGTVQVLATGTVALARGGVVDVSGNAGGGDAAIGTDLARAEAGPADTGAPRAAAVQIAAGSAIDADATGRGNAGRVTVLSQNSTTFDGAISARGGAMGGDGGLTELSSDGVIRLSGTVLDAAIDGRPGEILLDPATIVITTGSVGGGASSLSPTYIEDTLDAGGGLVSISATNLLEVFSPLDLSVASTTLDLVSGGDITIAAPVTVAGSLYIDAGGSLVLTSETGTTVINLGTTVDTLTSSGDLTATDISLLSNDGTTIDTTISAAGALTLGGPGTVLESSLISGTVTGSLPLLQTYTTVTVSGAIDTGKLASANPGQNGGWTLTNGGNSIVSLADVTLGGTLALQNAVPLTISGSVEVPGAIFISDDAATGPDGFSITGLLSATNLLVFTSSLPVLEASTGTVDTGLISLFTLNGVAASLDAYLQSSHNEITALDTFGAGIGTLALDDAALLTIASPVTIGQEFDFSGSGIEETGAGALAVPVFSGTAIGGEAELNGLNSIGTLKGFSGVGSFALNDIAAVTLGGNVTASNVFLTAPSLDLSSFSVTATSPGTLALTADTITDASGVGLFASGGTIMVAPRTANEAILIGTAGSAGPLKIDQNLLSAIENSGLAELILGGTDQTGAITLGDATVTSINLGVAILDLETTGSITDNAAHLAAGTLAFDGAGFTEASTGALNAVLVTGNGGAITGSVLLDGTGNSISSISNIAISGGTLSVADSASLLTAGTLAAGTIALSAAALTLDGNMFGTAALALNSGATIFQNAGTLTSGTLSGSAAGAISLGDAGNDFGTLAGLSAGGAILLDSSAFTLAGAIIAPGQTLTLGGGGVKELAGGTIFVDALTSDGHEVGGDVDLAAGSNTISLLTNFLTGGGFDLDDTGLLNLAGTIAAADASLTSTDTIGLGGDVDVPGLLVLGAAAGLTQTAGTLDIGTLASAGAIGGGDVALLQDNHIATLGGFEIGAGGFTLTDNEALDIAGVLNVGTGGTVVLTLPGLSEGAGGAIDAGTLDIASVLNGLTLTGANSISTLTALSLTGDFALNDSLALTLDGLIDDAGHSVRFGGNTVTEAGAGAIIAATLGGLGDGLAGATLMGANTIGTADGLTVATGLELGDASSLVIGNVQAGTATFANTGSGASFDVTGFLSVTSALDVDFAGGTLTESGSISAGSLVSDDPAIAAAVLDGVNHIGSLGSFDAAGTFSLADSQALTLTDNLIAAGISLTDTMGLNIDGLVEASTGGIALVAPAVDIEPGGSIDLASSDQVFSVAADTFANAGAITAPAGTFAIAPYTDSNTIDLGGTGGGAGTLDLSGADFAIADLNELIIGEAAGSHAGAVIVTSFSASPSIALVSLFATGLIEDAGLLDAANIAVAGGSFAQGGDGSIVTAGTLSAGGAIGGDIDLDNATNAITGLGAFTLANGTLTLNDQTALTVTGGVLARDITLEDLVSIALGAPVSVNSGGTIELIADALTDTSSAAISAPGGTVIIAPNTTGDVIDFGSVTHPGLDLSTGLISLITAGQLQIGTGGSALYQDSDFTVTANTLFLDATSIDIAGTLTAPGLLTFASDGGVTEETGGILDVGMLEGTGGALGLGDGNAITLLGSLISSGNITLDNAIELQIGGLVSAAGSITLEGNEIVETGSGALKALELDSGNTAIGGDVILTSLNTIGLLTDFTVGTGHSLVFNDATLLSVGALSAPAATLIAPGLDVTGAVSITGLLTLQSGDDVIETGAGAIDAGTLAGNFGGNLLLGGANTIDNLGAVSLSAGSGTLDLADTTSLSVIGSVTAPTVTLNADGLNFEANVSAGTALFIGGGGTVTQSAGSITTGTLATDNQIDEAISLLLANQIGTLAGITATGDIDIKNARSLDIAGLISTPGTLDLQDSAGITEIGAGIIDAGALSSGTGTIGGDLILTNANNITALANISLTGNFALSNTSALLITGALDTPHGDVSVFDTIGGITETGGSIDAATLDTGTIALGGDLLLGGTNTITNLGNLTLAGAHIFALDDSSQLNIGGTLEAGVFSLVTSAGVTENGGTITLGALSGSINNDAILANSFNSIGTLTNLVMGSTAALDVADGVTLTLAGFIDAPQATFSAPGLVFDGTINAGSVLDLTGSTITTEGSDGDIIVTLLTSGNSVDGSVFLLGTNQIGTIGHFAVSAGSTFALDNAMSLTVAGPLSGGFITLSATALDVTGLIDAPFTTLTGGPLTLDGNIVALDTLDLQSTGAVTGAAAIDTGLLTTGPGTITDDLSLIGANTIGTVGNLLIGGSALINDPGAPLIIGGLLSAGGASLALQDGLGITETTGTIIATTLTSGTISDGNVFLTGAANSITSLGSFTLNGNDTLALTDSGTLTIAGPVDAAFATFTVPTLEIDGEISSTSLALLDSTLVTETSNGTVAATTLTSGNTTDGDVFLTNSLNSIVNISTFDVGTSGSFAVLSTGAMSLAGPITAGFATFAAQDLTIAGLLDVSGQLSLGATGDVTETAAGSIDTGLLTSDGPIGGAVSLGNSNNITVIGGFEAGSLFALNDLTSFAIDGVVSAGTFMVMGNGFFENGGGIDAGTLTTGTAALTSGVTLDGNNSIDNLVDFGVSPTGNSAILLNDAVALTLAGTIHANTIGLQDSQNISQSGGAILATALTSNGGIDGAGVSLTSAANSFATLGAFSVLGNLALYDRAALKIAAPVYVRRTFELGDAVSIRQTGGSLNVGALTSDGAIGGGVTLGNADNLIGTIGNFTAAGNVFIGDAENLVLAGNIGAGAGLTLATGADNITQTAGTVSTATLALYGNDVTLNDANNIADLGTVAATNLDISGVAAITGPVNVSNATIISAAGLAISGAISASGNLQLSSGGDLQQSGGIIQAGNLNLVSNADITLAGTDIATGQIFSSGADGMQVSGDVSGDSVFLTTGGRFAQTGGTIAAGYIGLTGNAGISLAGVILAGNLNASTAQTLDDEAVTLTAASATFSGNAGIILNGRNSIAGALVATGGAISQSRGLIQANSVDLISPTESIDLAGGFITATTLAGTAAQGIILGDTINATGVTLTAGGNIYQIGTGMLNAASLAVNGGAVSLGGIDLLSGNLTAGGGGFAQSGRLVAANAYINVTGNAALGGVVQAGGALDVAAANIFEMSGAAVTGGVVNFAAGGNIELAGALSATSGLNLTAGDGLDETGAALVVADKGDLHAGFMTLAGFNTFTSDLTAVSTRGSIAQTGGVLDATTASLISAGTLMLDGTSRAIDELYLAAVGQIDAGGNIAAGTLAGQVTGQVTGANEFADFSGLNHIDTIGNFQVLDPPGHRTTFDLNNAGPLTLDGPLVADSVSITVAGQLTLEGSDTGGLFIDGPIEPKTQMTSGADDSLFMVTGASAAIVQTGTFYVDSGPLAGQYPGFANMQATLFFVMDPFGNISFEPAPPDTGGLFAPSIAAVFSPGAGGTISGNVDLLSLLLLNGKATDLTGMLDGLSGEAASGKGTVVPFPKPVFQFNACPIGSVNCIILPIETLPPGNPLQNFDIAQRKKKKLDKNVALPGVATRDF